MLLSSVFPFIYLIVWMTFFVFGAALFLRLLFNYTDPNPFGTIGRFSYHLKKRTDRFVYPPAKFLALYRLDTRLAPMLTLIIAAVLVFFSLQIVRDAFFVIDGLTAGIRANDAKMIAGFLLYAVLALFSLCIFLRILAQFFVFTRRTILGFVMRVTDPVMRPVQRLIPPIGGMIDLSPMIVLIVVQLLQNFVLRAFVGIR